MHESHLLLNLHTHSPKIHSELKTFLWIFFVCHFWRVLIWMKWMWTLLCCFIVSDHSFLKSIFGRWTWRALQALTATDAPYKAYSWTLHWWDWPKSSFQSYPSDQTASKHVFAYYLQCKTITAGRCFRMPSYSGSVRRVSLISLTSFELLFFPSALLSIHCLRDPVKHQWRSH